MVANVLIITNQYHQLELIKDYQKEARTTGGSAIEASAKKQANVTVNPGETIEVLANVEGVPTELSGGDQVEDVHMEVLEATVWSEHQTYGGKANDPNGTLIPASKRGDCEL